MNNIESIEYLGFQEGKSFVIQRDIEDINVELPYFQIQNRTIKGYNYIHHDNADRMNFIINYFYSMILKYISPDVDLSGFYNIELHDSNSYLSNTKSYKNCLVWCKNTKDNNVVLLPDLYHMIGYNGKLNDQDNILWHVKCNNVGFFGTTTGNRDPINNVRLKYCRNAVDSPYREYCDFKITNVAQMQESDVIKCYGQDKWNNMKSPWMHHTHLYNYKFNLDIPGNTASWDRVPLILNSKSILFKSYCTDMCFYYPLLQDGTHYVSTPDMKSIHDKRMFYLSNENQHKLLIENANQFAKNYLTPNAALRYFIALLESSYRLNSK